MNLARILIKLAQTDGHPDQEVAIRLLQNLCSTALQALEARR